MGTRARAQHRREHISQAFNAAQAHVTFTASPVEPFVSMRCALCAVDDPADTNEHPGYVCSWPIAATPTLGDLIDRAGIHFAQAHKRRG